MDGVSTRRLGQIWSVSPTAPRPVVLHHRPGYEFVLVNLHQTCFVTSISRTDTSRDSIACSDGTHVDFAVHHHHQQDRNTTTTPGYNYPTDLFVDSNGILWFKDLPPPPDPLGQLIYSMDPTTMIETLHSSEEHLDRGAQDETGTPPPPPAKRIDQKECQRTKILALFLFSALPTTVSSIYLWHHRHVPSMGVTTFVGIYGMAWSVLCYYAQSSSSAPSKDLGPSIEWLTMCLGAIWIIFMTNGIVSAVPHKAPMRWGLSIGSLSYFAGGLAVLNQLTNNTAPDLVWWGLFNTFLVAPLCLVGLATQASYPLVLTASGLSMNAFHLCNLWTRDLDPNGISVALIYLLVVGSTGLLTAFVGWLLSRRQQQVSDYFCAYLEPYAWPTPRRLGKDETVRCTAADPEDDEDGPTGEEFGSLVGNGGE
jgi:hypothetical protein